MSPFSVGQLQLQPEDIDESNPDPRFSRSLRLTPLMLIPCSCSQHANLHIYPGPRVAEFTDILLRIFRHEVCLSTRALFFAPLAMAMISSNGDAAVRGTSTANNVWEWRP